MKRAKALLFCLILLLAPMAGCTSDEGASDASSGGGYDATDGETTPGATPAEPTPSPYDVVCPDGTNETIQWGVQTCAEPVVYHASDVSNETVNLTMEWYDIAASAWGNYGPVEVFIIGESVEAAEDLEDVFCERHKALDENWNEEWDCANENHQIFSRYPEEGGAAISTFKRTYIEYDFMMMIMSAKYPGPDEDDYKPVTLHEYFHIFQHAHISDECTGDSRDSCERDAKMGGENTPWFAEGSAEFMAQSLYAQQEGVDENYLRNVMQWKLERSQDAYNAQDLPLYDIERGSDVDTYDVGAWFIAYVIHNEGEAALTDGFYGDVDELGFDGAFEMHFNKTKVDYMVEFDDFFAQSAEDVMALFPEASSPPEPESE